MNSRRGRPSYPERVCDFSRTCKKFVTTFRSPLEHGPRPEPNVLFTSTALLLALMARSVLHVLSQRPGLTGSGVALNALVQAAAGAGWRQAAVVGTPASDPQPAVGHLDPDEVHPLLFETEQLPFPLPGMSDVMPYESSRFASLANGQLEQYRAAWRDHLRVVIEKFQPDIIHSHHIWLLSSLVRDLTCDIPVVTHCHATGLRQLELCPHLDREVCSGCRQNDHFVVLHAGHAKELCNKLEISTDRVTVVGSGYRPDVFHTRGRSKETGPIVAYAGKLSRSKGLPWLLDAAERLSDRFPGFRLHIAGSGAGAEADSIRMRMQEMSCVVYEGQLDQADLSDLLRQAAVFVLPSFYEGLPLVLVEAAACGCRLVSTALPGVIEQLAPKLEQTLSCIALPDLTGPDEPVAASLPAFVDRLESAIEHALAQPPLADVERLVAELSWDGVFRRIEPIWNGLLNAGTESPSIAT